MTTLLLLRPAQASPMATGAGLAWAGSSRIFSRILGYNVTAFPTYLLLDRRGNLVLQANNLGDVAKKLPALAYL